MGPLEYADELGLDLVLTTLETLEQQFGSRFQPAALLRKKVNAGALGKKVQHGFREYTF